MKDYNIDLDTVKEVKEKIDLDWDHINNDLLERNLGDLQVTSYVIRQFYILVKFLLAYILEVLINIRALSEVNVKRNTQQLKVQREILKELKKLNRERSKESKDELNDI